MKSPAWMLYGANGFTGQLIAKQASLVGERPILAGRNANAVREVAERYGFQWRSFSLDDVPEIARQLEGIGAVLHTAGPFSQTSAAMVEACIEARASYLDITGEISVLEAIHARSEVAQRRGIVFLPAVGFDVVPSDCLAVKLKELMPEAVGLELAIDGLEAPSRGTVKTALEHLGAGGAARVDGRIQTEPVGERKMRIFMGEQRRSVLSVPWGDVSTAWYSTGIPNITTYFAMSEPMAVGMRISRRITKTLAVGALRRQLQNVAEHHIHGPDERARASGRSRLWGRVRDESGRTIECILETPESYRLTAITAVECVHRVIAGHVEPGAKTPAQAFGWAFITSFPGCRMGEHREV